MPWRYDDDDDDYYYYKKISDHICYIPEVLQRQIQLTVSFPSDKLQWKS